MLEQLIEQIDVTLRLPKSKAPHPAFWVCISVILVLAVMLLNFFLPNWLSLGKVESAGAFGDTFGAANALFSGLAFAGLIFTIWMQMKELKNQGVQIKEAARQLEESSKIQQQSIAIQEKLLNETRRTNELMASQLPPKLIECYQEHDYRNTKYPELGAFWISKFINRGGDFFLKNIACAENDLEIIEIPKGRVKYSQVIKVRMHTKKWNSLQRSSQIAPFCYDL